MIFAMERRAGCPILAAFCAARVGKFSIVRVPRPPGCGAIVLKATALKGHGFSRAANSRINNGALAPEGILTTGCRHLCNQFYYDFNVWSPEKTTEKLRYMHRNPVKRGLVAKPGDWPWSSYRHYATGERGTVEIESLWTARRREKQQ